MRPALLAALIPLTPSLVLGQSVRDLLASGDTAAAIEMLREDVSPRSGTAAEQCRLAGLLTRMATNHSADWRLRAEAEDLFQAALRHERDAACFLDYASLKQKQGLGVDASRLAERAFGILRDDPSQATPAVMAELHYRRAASIAAWVANFDHLVYADDLPVSTPACENSGYFCEAVHHPWLVFERLQRAERLDPLVRDERLLLRALLDSTLAEDPLHAGALRLSMREALVDDDWGRFDQIVRDLRAADPRHLTGLLAALTAAVHARRFDRAAVLFDSVRFFMGSDAMARYEGLALVADSSVRERIDGRDRVTYAEAVWGLSDPLYLTDVNERRVAHYARVFLADVLFTDPGAHLAGRDTPQGRLVIRYGPPRHWFQVRADRSRELTPAQREQAASILECGTMPKPGGDACTNSVVSMGQRMDGGGRWVFWFYEDDAPPFIFERALGFPTARHKAFTRSEALDSLLHRRLPSSYEPPFATGEVSSLATRFPRPDGAVVEVHARFAWTAAHLDADSAAVGVFVHDRTTGSEVQRSRGGETTGDTTVTFSGRLPVPWGRLRMSVEGLARRAEAAGQQAHDVELTPPDDALAVSDLLLGDSASGPDRIARRSQARFHGRADSLYAPGSRVALYWEIYGLRPTALSDDSLRVVRYRITLALEDAGGRPVLTELWRGARELVGLRRTREAALEWEVERPLTRDVAPELILLDAPGDDGRYRIVVTVADLETGRSARAERVIELRR